jgi:ABC-2 type transport system permease protein
MIQWRPVYVICLREFKKFFREKSRLLGTLARPVLWLFVVGNGMNSLIKPHVGFSYLQFIFPGMIGMTILFSSIFSSISIVWDREFGFMKEMLVAPISRLSIVIGKAISGTLISVAQAVIIMILIPFLGITLTFIRWAF